LLVNATYLLLLDKPVLSRYLNAISVLLVRAALTAVAAAVIIVDDDSDDDDDDDRWSCGGTSWRHRCPWTAEWPTVATTCQVFVHYNSAVWPRYMWRY